MIWKIMDKGDAMNLMSVCNKVEETYKLIDSVPVILKKGEEKDETLPYQLETMRTTLKAIMDEGLYPAYIPCDCMF